jgi:hypothetical protein
MPDRPKGMLDHRHREGLNLIFMPGPAEPIATLADR